MNGTATWDLTISQVTNILLVASLAVRGGDVMASAFDKQPLPFLTYGDIMMKLHGGKGILNLVAEVKVRNVKGFK